MRIIRGTHRARKIVAPRTLPVRPTTDYAKEGLFNILDNLTDISELSVLDLFAGTGSISYEFASRGCTQIVAVENNLQCVRFIKHIQETLAFTSLMVVKADVFAYIRNCVHTYDLIFADPPYALEKALELPDLIMSSGLLRENGLFIMEHSSSHSFTNQPGFFQQRNYGEVNFSFFRK